MDLLPAIACGVPAALLASWAWPRVLKHYRLWKAEQDFLDNVARQMRADFDRDYAETQWDERTPADTSTLGDIRERETVHQAIEDRVNRMRGGN